MKNLTNLESDEQRYCEIESCRDRLNTLLSRSSPWAASGKPASLSQAFFVFASVGENQASCSVPGLCADRVDSVKFAPTGECHGQLREKFTSPSVSLDLGFDCEA